ncbi:MAG: hypothetical protein ABJV04_00555 [Aliiglaciecola sp.]|uniref:hypothetical protein n=1 Tax=Aliiglaciecola sp. TaxID=1872441 RepID=UPI00329A54FF
MKFQKWADALLKATGGAKYVPTIETLRYAGLSETEAREFQQYLFEKGFVKLVKKRFYDKARDTALEEYSDLKVRLMVMGFDNAD